MKKLLTFCFAACLSFALFATDVFTYTSVKGAVKNYTQTEYSVASKFGSYYRTPTLKVVHVFDATGREVESTELTARDVVLDRITNNYDAFGNITEQVYADADGQLVWKNVAAYKNGKKESCSEYNANAELKAKSIFVYENSQLADETGYDADGALVWKTLYKYDSMGRVSKISQYSSEGALDCEETYSYADNGVLDSIVTYDSFTDTSSQDVFRYADGLLTEITTYDQAKNVTKRIVYKYDETGNPIKISCYNVAEKFGTTVNELYAMTEIVYSY